MSPERQPGEAQSGSQEKPPALPVVFVETKKHEDEERALPLLRINKEKKQAEIGGKVLRFRENNTSSFRLLVFLAGNPRRDIKAGEIKEKVFPELRYATVVNFQMRVLRRIIGDNKNKQQVISHAGRSHTSSYKLNARVEFINEDLRSSELSEDKKRQPGVEKKRRRICLGKVEAKAADVTFALNNERNGLEYPSAEDVFKAFYMRNRRKSKKTELKYRYSAILPKILEKIKQVWSLDPDSLDPKLGKFMKWLKLQPEYANAQMDDLAALAKREISFAEFLKKSGYSKPAAPVVPEGKSNGAIIDQETARKLKEMSLTDKETYILARLLSEDNRWIWGRAGVEFPEEIELVIEKMSAGKHDKQPAINDHDLANLRRKMELLDECREVFVKQDQSREETATLTLMRCVLRVPSSKWKDFIGTLIPQKEKFIGIVHAGTPAVN